MWFKTRALCTNTHPWESEQGCSLLPRETRAGLYPLPGANSVGRRRGRACAPTSVGIDACMQKYGPKHACMRVHEADQLQQIVRGISWIGGRRARTRRRAVGPLTAEQPRRDE